MVFEFESKDERNLFQFHDFFQIYTSAVQRFHENLHKQKQSTPAGPRSDKKYGYAFAEFLQNIYRNNLVQKYRNLSSLNHFQQFQKVFALGHKEEHHSTLTKRTNVLLCKV